MTRVFVVDDHPVVAQGVGWALDDEPDLEFVGAAPTLHQAVAAVAGARPDVVLLDVRIPDTDVVVAVRDLLRAAPGAAIVLFTADPSHPYVRAARAAGAVATVSKDTAPARLRAIIRSAAVGTRLDEDDAITALLTPRQQDVLVRVATGMTTIEIATELNLQATTVKAYWQEAMQRLGVRNRAEAIASAYRRGLL
ncbi:hypothetical protein ASE01_17060 [Nocardioides sp. Root190]|uniref:response regulator transcription factor n=1 Tax=Nocardioides sp. Root190 TaxID=1736488 RepID=UPI0006F62EEF|nr:response regulator transcription factor [Nocardioides sp. Root190]KRB75073.1 hypothetical protein ASE01_17060 [Nocardioides sp. Root190]